MPAAQGSLTGYHKIEMIYEAMPGTGPYVSTSYICPLIPIRDGCFPGQHLLCLLIMSWIED